jgi:hypothetical protein
MGCVAERRETPKRGTNVGVDRSGSGTERDGGSSLRRERLVGVVGGGIGSVGSSRCH